MPFETNAALFWFILGLAFLALEAMTPGFFLFFFGLGAWAAALAALADQSAFIPQFLVFMAASLLGLALFRKKLKLFLTAPKGDELADDPALAAQYLGRETTVLKETGPGRVGLVEMNGVDWRAETSGRTLLPGERARVKGLKGLTLIVESLEEPQ